MSNSPPKTLADLKARISAEQDQLSKRLRQVAQYLLENTNEIAFGTVAIISKDAGVHASTLVRFANAFGYSGFTEMQRVFQQKLLHESPSYSDRVRKARAINGKEIQTSSYGLLQQFAAANSVALDQLVTDIDAEQLVKSENIIRAADTIYIMGIRRAFVVASYFGYAIRHADRRAFLIDGIGGLTAEQSSSIRQDDALIAISFHPYAEETQKVAHEAVLKGIPVVLITDSELSPLASQATTVLAIKDAEIDGIRSLSAALCVAQALSVSLTLDKDSPASGEALN